MILSQIQKASVTDTPIIDLILAGYYSDCWDFGGPMTAKEAYMTFGENLTHVQYQIEYTQYYCEI